MTIRIAWLVLASACCAQDKVLWHDPGKVERVDFGYAAGGPQNTPRPPFSFVSEDFAGTNPKLLVRDSAGVEWRVKGGFEVKADITMPDGYRWLEVNPVGGETTVVVSKPFPGSDLQPSANPNIVFVADDILATYEELKARGVEFVDVPEKQPWGWWGSFKDPDGNVFGMGQLGD